MAARLSAIGVRIQKSVFECIVDDTSLAALVGAPPPPATVGRALVPVR